MDTTKHLTIVLMYLERASQTELTTVLEKARKELTLRFPTLPEANPLTPSQLKEVMELVETNEKLRAVKSVKYYSGMDLKESKDFVDSLSKFIKTGMFPISQTKTVK